MRLEVPVIQEAIDAQDRSVKLGVCTRSPDLNSGTVALSTGLSRVHESETNERPINIVQSSKTFTDKGVKRGGRGSRFYARIIDA